MSLIITVLGRIPTLWAFQMLITFKCGIEEYGFIEQKLLVFLGKSWCEARLKIITTQNQLFMLYLCGAQAQKAFAVQRKIFTPYQTTIVIK